MTPDGCRTFLSVRRVMRNPFIASEPSTITDTMKCWFRPIGPGPAKVGEATGQFVAVESAIQTSPTSPAACAGVIVPGVT